MANEWQLVIAGWDQNGHEGELRKLCGVLGLTVADLPLGNIKSPDGEPVWPDSDVVFVGSVYGLRKDRLLRSVQAFVLPSFSEGLPMSVLQAWAYGLPTLITHECNLPEGITAGAAVPIGDLSWKGLSRDQQGQNVLEALAALFSINDIERGEMGRRAVELVRERFTWERVASQMLETYRWILDGGPAPSFVLPA
jgi:poly(glycerol-phosphate) alpha-glucosyltransferase